MSSRRRYKTAVGYRWAGGAADEGLAWCRYRPEVASVSGLGRCKGLRPGSSVELQVVGIQDSPFRLEQNSCASVLAGSQ